MNDYEMKGDNTWLCNEMDGIDTVGKCSCVSVDGDDLVKMELFEYGNVVSLNSTCLET